MAFQLSGGLLELLAVIASLPPGKTSEKKYVKLSVMSQCYIVAVFFFVMLGFSY